MYYISWPFFYEIMVSGNNGKEIDEISSMWELEFVCRTDV